MRKRTVFLVVAALFAAFILIPNLHAQPLVNIETVLVDDAGNVADTRLASDGTTDHGAVSYAYRLGRYEVSIGQYTAFLSSVAAVTSQAHIVNLWNSRMATDANIAAIARTGSGTLASPYSYSVIGSADRPITFVSWFDAARFANWLQNGATGAADTETGAYTLNGATNGVIFRNPTATWWLPSNDEWYKGAYYKSGSTNSGYWLYPTQSDEAPNNSIGSASNQANYYVGVYPNGDFATGGAEYTNTQNYLTELGSFSGSESAYGTFDQGGNVREIADTVDGKSTVMMFGGTWGSSDEFALRSTDWRAFGATTYEDSYTGFRLATVPEPSTYALLAMSAGALWWARRRR